MKPLSLKARAIALLSQREHSATELRRKLLRIQATMRAAQAAVAVRAEDAHETPASDPSEVDDLLTWLQAQGYLSEARFIESRVHARASRWGQSRIRQELAQHGLALTAEAQAELKSTELDRALSVWQRKFGGTEVPDAPDAALALRARQGRFLTARGFAPEVVRQVLRAAPEREER